jgi:hypothetical protein
MANGSFCPSVHRVWVIWVKMKANGAKNAVAAAAADDDDDPVAEGQVHHRHNCCCCSKFYPKQKRTYNRELLFTYLFPTHRHNANLAYFFTLTS